MAELETAREFCDRVPRELGLVDFNSFEARRHLEKRLAERDKAVALRAKREGFAEGFRVACAARYQSKAVTERELAAINPYTVALPRLHESDDLE